MKKLIFTCTLVASLISVSAFADDSTTGSTTPASSNVAGKSMMMSGGHKACGRIAKACKSAGFTKGKGIYAKCMKPILSGQTVNGVTVDAADVQACQAKKSAHQKQS